MSKIFSNPSRVVDRYRRWLPVMQGLDTIDPLGETPISFSHPDIEALGSHDENIAFPVPGCDWDLPWELQSILGPTPGRCASLLLRSRPWRLSCQHSQVIDSRNRALHDPTTPWQGLHGRSWPLLRPRRIDGTVLCLTNHGSPNLYHWLFSPTLQLIRLLDDSGFDSSEVTGLYLGASYPIEWPDYVETTLRKLGLGDLPRFRKSVRPRTLLWAVHSATGCWPSHSQWQWLRKRIKPATSRRGRKLYLGRSQATRRRVVNERELMASLQARGFECIEDLAAFSFDEQCHRIAQADVIVAPHGAALSLLFCCHSGAKLLEFYSPTYPSPLYAALAHFGSLTYKALMASPVMNAQFKSMDDMVVDIEEVLSSLSAWGID